jgi:adenylate kinase
VVALIGFPGAGKGTQAQLLAGNGWFHINVGGLVRAEVAAGSSWGVKAAAAMRRGDLVPSQDVQDLLARELRKEQLPVVIEGFPRRLSEAGSLPRLYEYEAEPIYLWFDIPADAAMSRLAGRVVCARCECVARKGEHRVCPRCAGPLVSRDDDSSREAVGRRLQNFERETLPLIEYYQSRSELEMIDALLDESTIQQEIAARIAARC